MSYEGNVYSPEFWSNWYSNIYSLIVTFRVLGHFWSFYKVIFWSSLFGHVNNPCLEWLHNKKILKAPTDIRFKISTSKSISRQKFDIVT